MGASASPVVDDVPRVLYPTFEDFLDTLTEEPADECPTCDLARQYPESDAGPSAPLPLTPMGSFLADCGTTQVLPPVDDEMFMFDEELEALNLQSTQHLGGSSDPLPLRVQHFLNSPPPSYVPPQTPKRQQAPIEASPFHTAYTIESDAPTAPLAVIDNARSAPRELTFGHLVKAISLTRDKVDELQKNSMDWFETISTEEYNSSSKTFMRQISDLSFYAQAGYVYHLEFTILYKSFKTKNGISFSIISPDQHANGTLAMNVCMPGSPAEVITSLNDQVGTVVVDKPDTVYAANFKGTFLCTHAGRVSPAFRSIKSNAVVTICKGSVALIRRF